MILTQAEVKNMSDMDLVNIVNETEGFAWRLNHDAGDGRIPNEGVDDSIQQLHQTRDLAIVEIKERTGLDTHEELRDYTQGKLNEQDGIWDTQWAEIYNEGAVFKISKGNSPRVFETIRTYLPQSGTFGPNEYIFARVRGSLEFTQLDDRGITRLTKVPSNEACSLYANCTPEERGLIKAHEEPAKRKGTSSEERKNWHQFDSWDHTVFDHKGFNEVFEAIEKYNFPHMETCEDNEILLARSHVRPIFVEFTPKDLGLMEVVSTSPRYKNMDRYDLEKQKE